MAELVRNRKDHNETPEYPASILVGAQKITPLLDPMVPGQHLGGN
jgi:hypothetical protein